jgi:two-component system response regulator YesN
LVADDEQIMLDSICQMLGSLADITLETARTGREAIDKAYSFNPDVVLIDIRMPGINGLEALSELRRLKPNMITIVISAYDNFHYAQESIRLGVFEYLLKPINKARLLGTIDKAKRELEKEEQRRQENLELREKYKKLLPYIENEFLQSLISGIDELAFKEYQELLGASFHIGFFMVISYIDLQEVYKENIELKYYFRNKLAELVGDIRNLFPCFIGQIKNNRIVIFIPLPNLQDRVETEKTPQYYGERVLQHLREKNNGEGFRIGIGSIYSSPHHFKFSYHEAVQALNHAINEPLKIYPQLKKTPDDLWEKELCQYFQEILDSLRFGHTNRIETLVAGLASTYSVLNKKQSDLFRFHLLSLLLDVCKLSNENLNNEEEKYNSFQRVFFLFTQAKSLPDLSLQVGELIIYLAHRIKESQDGQITIVVQKAKQIIEEDYANQLSLKEVACAVNVSPFYLSRVFREEIGAGFVEYLTKVRLEKALELLAQGISVKECCFSVGYNDPNYFSRLFKKHYNVTPTQYRDGEFEMKGGGFSGEN